MATKAKAAPKDEAAETPVEEPTEAPAEEPETVDGEAVEIEAEEEQPGEELVAAAAMQQAVVLHERENSPAPVSVLPSAQEWEATMMMARTIAATPFVPSAYRGQHEAVVAAILFGREIGIGPMESLQKIHIIDGKPSMAADLLLGQMRRGGLVIVSSESTNDHAIIRAKRQDTGEECEVSWTIEEARAVTTREKGATITLDQKNTWRNFPADMLWARCVGRLARRIGSDLIGSALPYSSEEMQDWDDGGYGGSGYDTPAQAAPAQAAKGPESSKGVEARADAPRGFPAIMEVLDGIDPGIEWATWILQAAAAICDVTAMTTLREIPEGDGFRDCQILIGNAVANLVEARAGSEFPPPTRAEIQSAFGNVNAVGRELPGPEHPHDPEEAAAKAAEAAESDGDAEATPEQEEAPEGAESGDTQQTELGGGSYERDNE